jgi:drug/metabolite transporter (DMT)-like permease
VSNLALYSLSVLIWGSTWLAIKFQLGTVAPAVSVAWRFALAGAIMLAFSRWKRRSLRFGAGTHVWLALHGLLMFGINYVLVYRAEQSLPSGLVAVVFSLITFCNIAFLRLFFAVPVKKGNLAGAAVGFVGLAVLFGPDLAGFSMSAEHRLAVICCLVSPVVASLGNMTATYNHRRQLPIIQSSAWAMLYGALSIAAYAVICGERFTFDASTAYIVSLLYLALFGSVVAFVAYLTLLGRIGADRASYTSIAIPVVAMLLSTMFEHFRWDGWLLFGMVLCLAGNVLALGGWISRTPKASAAAR